MPSAQVSWAEFQTLPGVLSANQTMPPIAQSGTFDHADKSAQVSWAEFQTPASFSPSLTANQFVPAMTQVATMYDPIGTISGGGTVTETLPWRVVSANQVMPALAQSATMGDAPSVGLISANQVMPAITQAGAMDASRGLVAGQQVPPISQVASIVGNAGVGGGGKRRITEGPKRAITVNLKLDTEAQEARAAAAKAEADRIARQKALEKQRNDAVIALKLNDASVAAQISELNKKIESMQAKQAASVATVADMQAQIDNATTIAALAIKTAQELQDENEALMALL